jgi:hypothetical protein
MMSSRSFGCSLSWLHCYWLQFEPVAQVVALLLIAVGFTVEPVALGGCTTFDCSLWSWSTPPSCTGWLHCFYLQFAVTVETPCLQSAVFVDMP